MVPVAWFLLQFAAVRPLMRLPGAVGPVAIVLVAVTSFAWLRWLQRHARRWPTRRLDRPWPALALVVVVAAVGLVAYPIFDERASTGGGSDADDGVFLVIDGLRDGEDPYAEETYLGNAVTSGPGAALWFLPWSTRSTYPIGIALAVAATVAVVRFADGDWTRATLFAVVFATSVPLWEAIGQGSDHLPFACSLVWAAVVLDRRRAAPPVGLALALGVAVGLLATTRAAFFFVPAVAGATLWWRDRRAAVLVGATGSVVVVALHLAFIALSGWDDYTPVQQLLVKSDEDLNAAGRLLLVLGVVVAVVGVVSELRRRAAARAEIALLVGVGAPMISIALAGLLTASEPAQWSAGTYFLDSLALAALWFAGSALAPVDP